MPGILKSGSPEPDPVRGGGREGDEGGGGGSREDLVVNGAEKKVAERGGEREGSYASCSSPDAGKHRHVPGPTISCN